MSPLAPQLQRPAANGGCRSASRAKIGEIAVLGCKPRSRARQSAQRTSPGWSRRCCRTTLSVRLESITGQSSKRSPTRPSSSPPRLPSTASGRQRRAPGCRRSDVRTTPPCSTAATVASHRTSVDRSGLTRRESLDRTGDMAALGVAGHARQPRWAGSYAAVLLTKTADQLIRMPPASVALADRLQFVLGVGRRERGAAASGKDGQGEHGKCDS